MRRSFSFGSREASRVMRDHVRKLRCLLEAGGFAPLRRRRFAVSRDRCGVRSRTGVGVSVFLRLSGKGGGGCEAFPGDAEKGVGGVGGGELGSGEWEMKPDETAGLPASADVFLQH